MLKTKQTHQQGVAMLIFMVLVVMLILGTAGWFLAPRGDAPAPESAEESLPAITVWQSPTCGCCGDWVAHLEENGFTVQTLLRHNVPMIKYRLGLPPDMASCHTAMVEGYIIEGHVPAADIKRLLTEQPFARGLAVPGMPVGSPGMEMDGRVDDYAVLLFDADGETQVFNRYP
ncbi:DUF411 domain-containing protein [Isoalcanivorax indicus]|uniref:DUF411 domain-containing protein n=1 Tax=Isoalcanivorax indicus TaxID=2202653 RepID=UPI001FE4597F|nr:DUF411 domain-containing protein [Isoalcanivorax indicus]